MAKRGKKGERGCVVRLFYLYKWCKYHHSSFNVDFVSDPLHKSALLCPTEGALWNLWSGKHCPGLSSLLPSKWAVSSFPFWLVIFARPHFYAPWSQQSGQKGNVTTRWSEALSSSSSPPSSLVATHTTPTKWGTQIWRKGKSKKVYISYIKGLFAPTLRQELFRSPLQRSNQGWALLSLGYRFSYSRIIWHISYIVISRQYRDILYNISGQTVLVWKGWKGHLLFRFNSNTCPKLQWDKYMRMSQNAVYWIYVIFRLFKNMVYRNICPILYTYRSNPSKEYRSGVGPTTPTVQ